MDRLVVLGPGRIGLSLGQALLDADAVGALTYMGRHPSPPDHPLFTRPEVGYRYGVERPPPGTTGVFLTVPDHALADMARLLAGRGEPPSATPALHCSGALGAEPLEPLHRVGYRVGTLHPLQAVADPRTGAGRLSGAAFAVSGEREAMALGRRIVAALSGVPLTVPTQLRPLYHAAAVMASNYLVTLVRLAAGLLEASGATKESAEQAVVALARGTLENTLELGLGRALTGPVSRGDVEVVDLHLRTLSGSDRALYARLGLLTLESAAETLPPEVVGALIERFERYA